MQNFKYSNNRDGRDKSKRHSKFYFYFFLNLRQRLVNLSIQAPKSSQSNSKFQVSSGWVFCADRNCSQVYFTHACPLSTRGFVYTFFSERKILFACTPVFVYKIRVNAFKWCLQFKFKFKFFVDWFFFNFSDWCSLVFVTLCLFFLGLFLNVFKVSYLEFSRLCSLI